MFNTDELFKINLQLFADLEGVEDDDGTPDKDTPDDDDQENDVELEDLLKGIVDDEEDDEKTEDETQEEDEVEESKDSKADLPDNIDEIVNQRVIAEVNRIVQGRLARDRKSQEVAEFEQLTGMSLEQGIQTVRKNIIEAKAEELGISEEEARAIVDKDHKIAKLEAERTVEKQQQSEYQAGMQQVKYLQDKQSYMSKPKLARILKDCSVEIDEFTKNGSILSFEVGMRYVLGDKLATGELLQKVQAGSEQKAKANLQRQGKVAPQGKVSSSKSDSLALTKQEKQIAANLGVSEKEYAAEKLSEANRKQRKGR